MPYAVLDDETRLYYELTGTDDAPVVIQFGGGLSDATTSVRSTTASAKTDSGCCRSMPEATARPRRPASSTRSRCGHTTREASRRSRSRPCPRTRHVDGWHDRDRVHRAARRSRDRGVRRRGVREAGRVPPHAVSCLEADGRVDAVGRLLRPRHDAGGRCTVPRGGGRRHVRARPFRDRLERPVHGAAGVHCDGRDGSDAARDPDRATAADDERHLRHPLSAGTRAVRTRRPEDGRDEPAHHDPRVLGHRPRRPARVPG